MPPRLRAVAAERGDTIAVSRPSRFRHRELFGVQQAFLVHLAAPHQPLCQSSTLALGSGAADAGAAAAPGLTFARTSANRSPVPSEWPHRILVLVVLLLFGAKRLPEIGRGLGSGIHGFKEALTGPDEPAPEAEDR
jgi:sec-independent protein translocase protein TatA